MSKEDTLFMSMLSALENQRREERNRAILILAIIERRDDPAVKLREIKEILERVKG